MTDAANPRTQNRHGHIVRWRETGDSSAATSFTWEVLLQAGDPALATTTGNLVGNINGDTFSSPDGIGVDPVTKKSMRFLVGPLGCEITGLTWTPDLRSFFINVQHPTATVVVRRTDGRPIGA